MTHEDVLNTLLAHACAADVLQDGWNLYRIELCCFTYEVVARCINLIPGVVAYVDDYSFKYEIRSIQQTES